MKEFGNENKEAKLNKGDKTSKANMNTIIVQYRQKAVISIYNK